MVKMETCMKGKSFNTQPPEGGWVVKMETCMKGKSFNTQPPEGGWTPNLSLKSEDKAFQHTAARRRLDSRCDNG